MAQVDSGVDLAELKLTAELTFAGHTLLNLAIGNMLASHGETAAQHLRSWGAAASILAAIVAIWYVSLYSW